VETEDGRVILFFIIAVAVFVAGRRYQTLITTRRAWRDTRHLLTARKQVAANASRSMVWVAIVTVLVFWLVANLNRLM